MILKHIWEFLHFQCLLWYITLSLFHGHFFSKVQLCVLKQCVSHYWARREEYISKKCSMVLRIICYSTLWSVFLFMKELIRGGFVFSLIESFLTATPEIKYSSDVSIRELHLSHSAKDKKKAANVNGLIRNYRVYTLFLSASFSNECYAFWRYSVTLSPANIVKYILSVYNVHYGFLKSLKFNI